MVAPFPAISTAAVAEVLAFVYRLARPWSWRARLVLRLSRVAGGGVIALKPGIEQAWRASPRKSRLKADSPGLVGVLMQGLATMAPAFALLSTFVFTVGLAGLAAPVAYLFAGIMLLPQALSVSELARAFPSAGGWYTWIARSLHPRAGFFAGWYVTLWLPLAPTLIFAYVASTVLTPCVAVEYGVTIPVWLWTVVGVGGVAFTAYRGVAPSERVLLVAGLTEMAIMLALAISGLLSPGRGGFSLAPFDPQQAPTSSSFFVAVVFSIFAYSGWEAVAPLAEESRDPRRNVPRALVGSVLVMIVFLVLTGWGYLIGIGTSDVAKIRPSSAFPVFELARRVWGRAWVLGPLAMLNSALAASAACFNGGTRTWYGMARSGSLPKALAMLHPVRKTPDNAIHAMLACQLLSAVLAVSIKPEIALPVWGFALTLGLITMYVLANLGVLKYYATEGAPSAASSATCWGRSSRPGRCCTPATVRSCRCLIRV